MNTALKQTYPAGGQSELRRMVTMDKGLRSSTLRPALLVLLLGAFGLRLYGLTLQNIWWDEARNLDVALRPLLQIAAAPELDIQPPLYYWLLHGWSRLHGLSRGADPAVAAFLGRYVSGWFALLAVALVYRLARLGLQGAERGGAGLAAATLAALSPFWLAESQETRMYTLGFATLAVAALALLQVTAAWRSPAASVPRYPLLAFVLLSAAGLWIHYNVLFVLVAWYGWWSAVALLSAPNWPERRRRLGTVLLAGVGLGILLLPLAPLALGQISGYANPNLTVPTVADYLWQNWAGFLGGYAWTPGLLGGLGRQWLWLLALGCGLGAAALALQGRSSAGPETVGWLPATFLLVWLVGGLGLFYVAVLDRGAFNIRYSSFVTPALYALLGILLAKLGRIWRPLLWLGLGLCLLGMGQASHADLTDSRFFRDDTAGLVAWLQGETVPGDLILVDQKYPFGFYYADFSVDPESAAPLGEGGIPARYLFVDINAVAEQLNRWAGGARRFFWVQWHESDTDPRGAVPFLLDQVGRRGGEQIFQGYRVNWWTLSPPNHFALADALTPQRHRFPPAVESVAVSLPNQALRPGGRLSVVIRWAPGSGGLDRPLKARVALYDQSDARRAQDDRRLLNDRHLAPAYWWPSDRPLNVYSLPLPADLAPGLYAVRLLVYDAESLAPLGLVDAAGADRGVEAFMGQVLVAADR